MVAVKTVVAIAIPVLYVIFTIVYEAGNYIYYDKRSNMNNPPKGVFAYIHGSWFRVLAW